MMIHGAMNYSLKGKKKKVNYWTTKKRKPTKEFVEYTPDYSYRTDATQEIKSLDSGVGETPKREPMQYTGTLVKGISTMHKSNAVPIISEDEAKEHASMRR
jgi:hypothetical protein